MSNPPYKKKFPSIVSSFNSDYWNYFRDDLENLTEPLICSDLSVEQTWSSLHDSLLYCLDEHIPSRQFSKRERFPFITWRLKKITRKRNRHCYLSKRINSNAIKNESKKLKSLVQKQLRSTYQRCL